ncbi:MAG: DNA replication/repair protein RecF [Gemmatimonadales bacterium]
MPPITQLTVRSFRNLASLDVEIPETGVVVIGENGQGKTNFLEAIYYLVLFRSMRGARDRELVRFGESGFFVAGTAGQRVTAGYEVAGRRKKVTADGKEIRKLAQAVGLITAVQSSPADRSIVNGGPAGRRRYLDVLLSLCSSSYLKHLTAMRAAMKQRNAALKRGRPEEARAFDRAFAGAAALVAEARHEWAEECGQMYVELLAGLGESGNSALEYHSRHWTPEGGQQEVERCLLDRFERDVRMGMTTVGPHRDDLVLTLDGRELRRYGSAGQQRTAAIALRLLEARALGAANDAPPIALLDDVFAELDQNRQTRLLSLIDRTLPGQVIITAPRDSEVPDTLFDRPRWSMNGGRIDP